MTIHVTEQHIKNGRKGGAGDCPISLALSAAMFRVERSGRIVTVGRKSWTPKDGKTFKLLPQNARDFIADLDGGKPVKPFSFEV